MIVRSKISQNLKKQNFPPGFNIKASRNSLHTLQDKAKKLCLNYFKRVLKNRIFLWSVNFSTLSSISDRQVNFQAFSNQQDTTNRDFRPCFQKATVLSQETEVPHTEKNHPSTQKRKLIWTSNEFQTANWLRNFRSWTNTKLKCDNNQAEKISWKETNPAQRIKTINKTELWIFRITGHLQISNSHKNLN